MTHRIKDGWKLYYSEEGYPYYFNELTGESEWADTKEVDGFQQSQQQHSQENYSDPEGNGGDEEEDEDSESRSNQLNDEESGASDTSSTFDEAFNEKFKAFLRTPEGIEAVIVRHSLLYLTH